MAGDFAGPLARSSLNVVRMADLRPDERTRAVKELVCETEFVSGLTSYWAIVASAWAARYIPEWTMTPDGWLLFATRCTRLFAYGILSVVLVLCLVAKGLTDAQIG